MANRTSNTPETTKTEAPKMELSYGDYKTDFDAMLASEQGRKNVLILATKQVAHKMSNEVDSSINAWVRDQLDLPSTNPKDMSQADKEAVRARITAYRESHKAAVDEELKSARDEMWDTIVNGVIGFRAGGPRKDPVLVEFDKILGQEARKTFREQNYKTPDDETAKFPTDDTTKVSFLVRGQNGDIVTVTRTRPELLANYKTRHGDRLMDKAREIVALRDASTPQEPAQADVGF